MIPEAAVEAAAVAWVGRQVWQDCDEAWKADYMERTRLALEAATPHLLSGAWDEGFDRGFYDPLAGRDRDPSESRTPNPYRSQS